MLFKTKEVNSSKVINRGPPIPNKNESNKSANTTTLKRKKEVVNPNEIYQKIDEMAKVARKAEQVDLDYALTASQMQNNGIDSIIVPSKMKIAVNALFEYIGEYRISKEKRIWRDFKYILNVTSFKISNCPKRIVKIPLQHPVIADEDDICFIVKDKKRGSSEENIESQRHEYEKILHSNGIKNVTVKPFAQLKKEYGSYEMKIKLLNSYDVFLCDGSIIGHVVGFLGKKFHQSRCPIPVRGNTKNIGSEVKRVILKTAYRQGQKGAMISIPIATDKTAKEHIVDNIMFVISQLKDLFPGGYANIRNIFLKANISGTNSIPLYISLCTPPLKNHHIVGLKEQNLKRIASDYNESSNFRISSTGKVVKVNRKPPISR